MASERNIRIITTADIGKTVAAFIGSNEDIYLENTEWTASALIANFDFSSANDPKSGSVSIETIADMGASNYLSFDKGSLYQAGVNELRMWFKCKVLMNVASSALDVQFYKAGLPVGNSVQLFGTPALTFGVNGANITSYQEAVIPFASMGVSGDFDELRISSGAGISQREFFLDDIRITGNGNIYEKINALAVGTDIGSSSNAANQQFSISLEEYGFSIGDIVRIGNAYVRGDLSADVFEFIDVGFGAATSPKERLGEVNYDDLAVFRTDGSLIDRSETVVDIGGGIAGINVFVSPAPDVNFSPAGMPNGWWWQFKCDVLIK